MIGPQGVDRAGGLARHLVGMAVGRTQREERPAVAATEHAGERGHRRGNAVGHLAPFEYSDELRADGVGEPDTTRGIEATTVRRRARDLGPHALLRERRIGPDRERLVATAERLADDERAAVGCDDRAVGKGEPLRPHGRRAVGPHECQIRWSERGAAVEIESEVADVRVPDGVDHHVVAVERGDVGEIGVFDEPAGTVAAHQLSRGHEHSEE